MLRCAGCQRIFPQGKTLEVCPECGGTVKDDPQVYIPQRFAGGKIRSHGLEISLRESSELLEWDKIRMVCLGLIEEPSLDVSGGAYHQVKQSVEKMFAKKKERGGRGEPRQTYYLELFVEDRKEPFRAESTNVNYRDFIEEVEYIS